MPKKDPSLPDTSRRGGSADGSAQPGQNQPRARRRRKRKRKSTWTPLLTSPRADVNNVQTPRQMCRRTLNPFYLLFDVMAVNIFMCYYANSVLYAKATGMKMRFSGVFPFSRLVSSTLNCCVHVLYRPDGQRGYLFTPTSILKCNFSKIVFFFPRL